MLTLPKWAGGVRALALAALSLLLTAAPAAAQDAAAEAPRHGGTLTYLIWPEPPMLTSALSTSGPISQISPKIHDGLVTYDLDFNLQPQLAESWTVSDDGLTITFDLRQGVTWHDGEPFTSADVAFSIMEVWKVAHSRGRSTFANVQSVETPDDYTAVLHLSEPAPYLMNALASMESQVVARHIYEGTDLQTNPNNNAPVGTGPFRFVEWERGSYVLVERNPDYWDQPKPYLDRIIFRFIPDGGGRAAAIESGEADLVGMSMLPMNDVQRLEESPELGVETDGYGYLSIVTFLGFNLDREPFQDLRVRQAIAHAVDRDLINRLVWFGYGKAATGPVHQSLQNFYTADVPSYPLDLEAAERLLDEAGYPRGADGVRFSITHDYMPFGEPFTRLAEYLKQALGQVGIAVEIRNQDYATWVTRVFTDRDFDLITFYGNNGPDPTIGVQRFYWSENFQPGVAFSNAAHYDSEEMDRILEATQSEVDPAARQALFHDMQRLAMEDLPYVPLVAVDMVTVYNERVHGHTQTADGVHANFADVYLTE